MTTSKGKDEGELSTELAAAQITYRDQPVLFGILQRAAAEIERLTGRNEALTTSLREVLALLPKDQWLLVNGAAITEAKALLAPSSRRAS